MMKWFWKKRKKKNTAVCCFNFCSLRLRWPNDLIKILMIPFWKTQIKASKFRMPSIPASRAFPLTLRTLHFVSSLPTWHLECQKSIMSSSQMKGQKKLVYCFKVGRARLWHGTLQRERKITPHTWSMKKRKAFEMDCWVGSSLAQVMALMAQPLGVGILGLDKTVAGLVSVGTGPSSGSS